MTRGIASAEVNGVGVVLADSATGVTLAPERIATDDALRALFTGDGDAYGWHIDPTVNCWALDLPAEERIKLMSSQPARWGDGWRALYVPGRFLSVKYGSRGRHQRTLYDLSAMFPGERGNLAGIAQRWGVSVPNAVPVGDHARAFEFEQWPHGAVAAYCEQRAEVVARLADVVLRQLARLEIDPYGTIPSSFLPPKLYGIGSVGTVLLKASGANRWVARYHPERQPMCDGVSLLPLFLRGYYGGRIECAALGVIRDGPIWRYDQRSAYAWALSWVGAVGYQWRHVRNWLPDVRDRMSIWRVSWNTPSQWLGPFPWRDGSRRGTVYPTVGSGWYWWPEIRAALALHGPEAIQIHEGYASPRSTLRPLLPAMAAAYELRKSLEAASSPAASIAKGAANAVWGKLSQTISVGGLPGRFYNPALAGWVSSAVRAALLQSVGADDTHVAALMTDGYISDREPRSDQLTGDMGSWRAERFEQAELYAPGIYRLWRGDGSFETAHAGVQWQLDYDWLADTLTRERVAEVKSRWFVPHIVADVFPGAFEARRCRWVESSSTIDPRVIAAKRQGSILLADLNWACELRTLGPWGEVGDALSTPYHGPPAWQHAGFDPVYESAAMALHSSR